MNAPTLDEIRGFRRRLLRWYRQHGRELPWRVSPRGSVSQRPDPYHVLVSEVMLQQTRVETVEDYFKNFIARFPTLDDLASAEEGGVLRGWQGLGYYRRARKLHAAARQVVEEHEGAMPRDPEALRRLPGVGPYTAGAIASIAFGRMAPCVDGNVARVLARWRGVDVPVDGAEGRATIESLAEALISPRWPGAFNQALMDLGATICRKHGPLCGSCPLSSDCRSSADGSTAGRPRRSKGVKPKPVSHTVLALRSRGRFLYERRPDVGLWSGMWQLPTMEAATDSGGRDLAGWARTRYGWTPQRFRRIGEFQHLTTHRSIEFSVVLADVQASPRDGQGRTWRRLGDHDDLPLANPQRRAVALIRDAVPLIETPSQ